MQRAMSSTTAAKTAIQAIYTDGSGNLGTVGYAAVIRRHDGTTVEIGGSEQGSTNQRAELLAVRTALEYLRDNPQDGSPVEIVLDSQYAIDCATEWAIGWRRNGWKTQDGSPVKNRDLIESVSILLSTTNARLVKISAHSDTKKKARAKNEERFGVDAARHQRGNIAADGAAGRFRVAAESDKPDPESRPSTSILGWIEEFRKSAIPDRLTLANVEFCGPEDGEHLREILVEHAIAAVQKSTHYAGSQARRILDRYSNMLEGGWVAFGTTIDGGQGEVAMVKPSVPREAADFKGFGEKPKLKAIKYETPPGSAALPILPYVDEETAQAIYDRHNITPNSGESFWRAVQRSGCPIAITEGLKKAMCLIAHGIPAIALRGVACWHPKSEKHLYQAIADFATQKRTVYICFDADLKASTVRAVGIQINQLGKALEKCGAAVEVMSWHPEEGKGVDDAIAAKGDGGQEWLEDVIDASLPLKAWIKAGMVQRLKDAIRRAKALPFAPDRETEGDFLPQVPDCSPGTITILEAPTGSGKTHEIARQVKTWIEAGGNVMLLYSLNSLGQQAAERCNELPHIRDYWMEGAGEGQAGRKEFQSAISAKHGVVLCYDSLHHIPEWFYDRPLMLILDEVNQGLDHVAQGGTLKERQAEIMGKLAGALKAAGGEGAIILAEARVYPHSLELVKKLSGCESVKYYRHDRIVDRGRVEITSTSNAGALVNQALNALARGEKIMWCTSSQKNARRMERILSTHNYSTLRIDSETNRGTGRGGASPFVQFFTTPDGFLEAKGCPDALIVSPTCKTGLSIEQPWFDRVFGYFPNTDPDTAMQMLARYRLPAPRHVAIPPFVHTSSYESIATTSGVKARIGYNQKASAQYLGLDAIAAAEDDESARAAAAFVDFYVASASLRGAQKQISFRCLADTLEAEGFEVLYEFAERSDIGEAEVRAAREWIWRKDAATLAATTALEDWRDYQDKPCTLDVEWAATKGRLIETYPGIDWDCPETCYYSYTRQDELMRRGVTLQALCEDLPAANLMDQAKVEAALKSGLLHKVPTFHLKALLLNKIGVLRLLEGGLVLDNNCPVCIEVADLARRFRKDLRFYSGFNIGDESIDTKGRRTHTPVDVCAKLLKPFGLEMESVSRLTANGKRERQYGIVPIVPRNHDGALENPKDRKEIKALKEFRAELEEDDRLIALKYRQQLLEAAREGLARMKAKEETRQPEPQTEASTTEPQPEPQTEPPTPSGATDCGLEDETWFEFAYEFEPEEDTV